MAAVEVAQDDPLQAVVLCDVFTQRFAPLTLDRPRCLMPVCNVPLIEWTLESLAAAGVHEVFFLATWHVGQIRAYLEKNHPLLFRAPGSRAPPAPATSLTRISLIAVPEARSVGDTMRELDAHQVIKSDFVLMQGDALGTMDIGAIVRAHKERRQADRNAIMTIGTMPAPQASGARRPGDLSVFVLAPSTSQLLHYAAVPALPRVPLLLLPLELMEQPRTELDVRNDLVDCGVDVCSIDVPPLFTENFDYQALRREFVQGILTSDLLEAKIFVHVAPPAGATSTSAGEPFSVVSRGVLGMPPHGAGYMLRVSDPARYDTASRDVLAGWTYPNTPRLGMPDGTTYTSAPGLRFTGAKVTMARTAVLGRRTLLGAHVRLDDGAQVHESVLGEDVHIGAHSVIRGSYLWRGTQVGEGCTLDQCLVGEGVQILDHVHLQRGTIVGDGCVIGPGVRLAPAARVSMHAYRTSEDEEDVDDVDETDTDAALGPASRGYLWPPLGTASAASDDSDEEVDELEHAANAQLFAMGADRSVVVWDDALSELSSIDADSEADAQSDESSEAESDESSPTSPSAYGSVSLTLSGGHESQTYGEKLESEERRREFEHEARASLERAFDEKHAPENAAIELKTLRMASNVPPGEVRKVVISFVLSHCAVDQPRETAALLDHWGPLIREVAHDDQVEALAVMQSFCALHVSHTKLFGPLLTKVYNDEMVSDEAILAWWRHPSSRQVVLDSETPSVQAQQVVLELRKRAEPVVRHILEGSDESDEESE